MLGCTATHLKHSARLSKCVSTRVLKLFKEDDEVQLGKEQEFSSAVPAGTRLTLKRKDFSFTTVPTTFF